MNSEAQIKEFQKAAEDNRIFAKLVKEDYELRHTSVKCKLRKSQFSFINCQKCKRMHKIILVDVWLLKCDCRNILIREGNICKRD